MSGILGGSEDNDGIDTSSLISSGCMHDSQHGSQQIRRARTDDEREEPTVGMRLETSGPRGGYSCPSNSTICSDGMAPCRSRRQAPSPLARSTIVEGMSRGD